MFGILNLCKPSGITSRDVVNQVQRLVRPVKLGHAGTLDPLASGVLLVCLGPATRLVEYLHELPKTYLATFLLGQDSDTEDIDGQVTVIENAYRPSHEELLAAALRLTGQIEQRPPAYSAKKVAGRRAYAAARAGDVFDLAPATVRIDSIAIVRYEYPELQLRVTCGTGTYIRSLGRDLAEAVGTAAVMSSLVRTAIGPFTIAEGLDADTLTIENIAKLHISPALAVADLMPRHTVSTADARCLGHGQSIVLDTVGDVQRLAAVDLDGRLIAILKCAGDARFAVEKYFPSTV